MLIDITEVIVRFLSRLRVERTLSEGLLKRMALLDGDAVLLVEVVACDFQVMSLIGWLNSTREVILTHVIILLTRSENVILVFFCCLWHSLMVNELRQLSVRKLVGLLFELPDISHDRVFESNPVTLLVPVAQQELAEVHEFLVRGILKLTIFLNNEAEE